MSPASGSGLTGQVVYHLAANPGATLRTGLITIGGTDLLVIQSGNASCEFNVNPSAIAAAAEGAAGQLSVTASDGHCGWSASSDVPWVTLSAAQGASGYAQTILADDPIGYWRLDETAGAASVADASGSGHVGIASSGVNFGQSGPMADGHTTALFDGSTGAVEVPHATSMNAEALTWEAWVNVPAIAGSFRRVLGKGGTNDVFSLWVEPNSTQVTLYFTTSGGRQSVTLPATIVGAGWAHVAFTYDATGWHAYVNGVEATSGPATGTLLSNIDPLIFGRDHTSQSWYGGQLGDVALYSYALNADQIAHHFAQRLVTITGSGQVNYTVASNATGTDRTGTVTIAGISVPVTQATTGGVAIAGGAAPSPNAAGWNNTEVTVGFVCAGAGTISCEPPVTLTQEGEHTVAGSASNTSGASAETTVTVQIDRTAPHLSISSPVRGAVVPSGPVTVKGSVFDALSEPTVRCEGVPAVVSNLEFECIVSIASGKTTIAVDARDTAGNTITTGITLTTTDAVIEEPTSLRITPQNVTLTNGEERRFRVVDDRGRVPTDAVWSIDNSTMATLAGPNDPRVTGVSAGQVTLTVTWRGLSASTEIDILGSGGVLTPGATLWSAPPIRGAVDQIVQGVVTIDGRRQIYVVEHDETIQDIIRAFDVDGGEVWSIPTQGRVTQLSGDPFGGVVALVDTTITPVPRRMGWGSRWPTMRRVD